MNSGTFPRFEEEGRPTRTPEATWTNSADHSRLQPCSCGPRHSISIPNQENGLICESPVPVCYALYHLWAPFIDVEHSELSIHTDWLTQHLMDTCPTHANDIRTPDPSAEKARSYWLEEARAKAIQEAEDAGLEGPEREAYIRQHTEGYFADLLMRRVG